MLPIRSPSVRDSLSPSPYLNDDVDDQDELLDDDSDTRDMDAPRQKRQTRLEQNDVDQKKKSRSDVQSSITPLQMQTVLEILSKQQEEGTELEESGEKKVRKPRKKKGFLFNETFFLNEKIPFPILQHSNGRDDILDSSILSLWSPKDLNLSWIFDFIFYFELYYSKFSQCKTYKERCVVFKEIAADTNLNTPGMMMEIATLTRDSFRIAVAAIQHFCARIDKKQMNTVTEAIEKGLYVLYHYVFYYWCGYNEPVILSCIDSQIPGDVQILPIEEAFKLSKESFAQSGKRRYRSTDKGGNVFFVNKAEEHVMAEKAAALVRPFAVKPVINVGFLSNANRYGASGSPSSSSSSLQGSSTTPPVRKPANQFMHHVKTTMLTKEQEEKLFPKKFIPPIDPQESYFFLFKRKYGEETPLPTYIIKVPWTQLLGLLSRHEIFYMEKGYAYLNYAQIADWMRDKWNARVSQLRKWDEENITWPWLDAEYAKYRDVIPINIDSPHREFIEFLKKFNERTFHAPLKAAMKTGLIFSLAKKSINLVEEESGLEEGIAEEEPNCDSKAVSTVYHMMFETGKKMEDFQRRKILLARKQSVESRAIDDIPPENEIFYQPVEGNITGVFFKDYGRIMPPCIRSMYETHTENRTHFKNDERLKFFWWAFKASVPLDLLMEMWSTMVDNDGSIPQRDRETLKREARSLYQKHQRSRESGNEYNFFGCGKMASYCPFANQGLTGDIEDLGNTLSKRKIQCGGSLWEKKIPVPSRGLPVPRWPGRHLRIWSPMTATAILSNYYMNKI